MTLEAKLNKLIELGWKPRGQIISNPNYRVLSEYSLNDLCSIDSGLRQFVCEKGLYDGTIHKYIEEAKMDVDDMPIMIQAYNMISDKYRIMLSSIQENKEKFLLDNIFLPTP